MPPGMIVMAPALAGSDGRIHPLAEFKGQTAVVLAGPGVTRNKSR